MAHLSIPVLVVDRRTIMAMLDLSPAFVERWLARGAGDIPQMPHFPGKPVRFHIAEVEAWYLKHFQRGGRQR
jgi:hypothetical protein